MALVIENYEIRGADSFHSCVMCNEITSLTYPQIM